MANTRKKIYNITVDGSAITFFQRTQGQAGRDIAAVKLALGDVYMAPKQNNSPEDTSTGEAWFNCETNEELSVERLLTFDKKLKSSLMSFQIEHQFLIMSYYFEKYYVKNIRNADEESLVQQLSFMLNSFDVEFGTIGESTIAILHGYRPGANASNMSFVNTMKNPVDMVPLPLYDSYMNGTIAALPSEILSSLVTREENLFEEFENAWEASVSAIRNWSTKLPQVEVAYAEYIAHSYVGNLAESDLYVATREVLEFASNPQYTEELTPAQRERLVSRAFEPDHLLDPDPFVISASKIGFFDRTEYTFRNLPEFENLSQDVRSALELTALNKVLKFFQKQSVEQIEDPLIINFIDFRTPSLRPGDVYRAYFEIDRELLDSQPDLGTDESSMSNPQDLSTQTRDELERVNKEISDLYCADGGDPSDEQVRIQYERYRSFAAKKKLEITRKIRQSILQEQEQNISIDGVELDLGVFGKGSISESDMQNLIASIGIGTIEGIGSIIGKIPGLSSAGSNSSVNGDELVINYMDLVESITTVADNFEDAQKDLANFSLAGDPYFSAINEAKHLRAIPSALKETIFGDVTLKKHVGSVTDMDNWVADAGTQLKFKFVEEGLGSRIVKISITSTSAEPNVTNTLFESEILAEQIDQGQNQLAPQEGQIGGALRRYRTVHYLRNINDLMDKSSSVRGFFNKLANPQSTCDTSEEKKSGTGTEYILRYTKGITKTKKPGSLNPIHNWKNPSGEKMIENITKEYKSIASRKDQEAFGFWKTGVELEKVFGFEHALPQLGPAINTETWASGAEDTAQRLLKELSSLLNYKRLLCEYAACMGVPDVQISLPNLSLPEWPKIPMMQLPGSDFKEQANKMAKDIVYRLLYSFLKGIIDILKTPFCSEKFIADLYGAASDTSPLVKKALADGFLDTGIPASKAESAKDLIDSLLDLLTPSELCALLNGDVVNDAVYHIVRATAAAYNLTQELETEEQITNFFLTLGIFVGPEICENLSRYDNVQQTCEDIYSIVGQVRNAILQGEEVTQQQLNSATAAAQEEFEKKRDALNFLTGEGGLADLLPDFSSLENNIAFSTPSELIVDSAKLAAGSALKLSKSAFVRSLNSFVASFYIDEHRVAVPGDDIYEPEANRVMQRATCNLQRFGKFVETDDFNINNLGNRTATDSLRKALVILSDDYKTEEMVTDSGFTYDVYKLNEIRPNQQTPTLLKNPLSQAYPLFDSERDRAASLSLSSNQELSRIWEYLFPISAGDLQETTRTISSFSDWLNPIFRGEQLSSLDVLTLNTNYLNKMNQIISILQQDISTNVEKAFRVKPDSKFLSGIETFYNIDEESEMDGLGRTANRRGELIHSDNYATNISLKHPVLPPNQAGVIFSDSRRVVGGEDHVLTKVSLRDNFFFGTGDSAKIFTSCDKIPDSLRETFLESEYTRDIKKTLFNSFFKKNINKYLRSYSASDRAISDSVEDDLLKTEFKQINEGIIEQLVSEVRESRIFNDADYLSRMDSKLRSRFYYDPATKCFKNPNNLLKYGIFNYEKIVTDEFEQQYRKEYGRPENSDILRDYTKPGAFEKALMNTSVLGFIRVALIDLLLKGSISFSVWDFDFLKGSKFFREYIINFIENQLSKQDFFHKNRERLDETLIRLSGVNNISAAIKKITLREVDTTISDLSKKLYENNPISDYDIWFLDNIPLVGVPDSKDQYWLSNLNLQEVEKFNKNHFTFLEEYIRVNGPLRNFESSRAQIATAQYNKLQEVTPRLRHIERDTNLTMPTMDADAIARASSVDINMYNDTDRWPNRELLSVNEFSEIIRSLLDNNKELSKFFHDFQNKIYSPSNTLTHGAPETIKEKFPSRPIIRTRKRYEFSGANIFSSLFAPGTTPYTNDLESYRSDTTNGQKIDKFRIQNKVNVQSTDSAHYWAIVNEETNVTENLDVEVNESELGNLLRKSLGEVQNYPERYYISSIPLESAVEQMENRSRNPIWYQTTTNGMQQPHPHTSGWDINDDFYHRDHLKRGIPGPTGRLDVSQNTLEEEDFISLNGETIFQNLTDEVSKEQYDFIVSSSAEPEYWEETVIDLVGDASPIFNQPGDSKWDPMEKLSSEQKLDIGKSVNRMKFFLTNDEKTNLISAIPDSCREDPGKFLFSISAAEETGYKIAAACPTMKFGHIAKGDGRWDFSGYHESINHNDISGIQITSRNEHTGCFDLTYASNNVKVSKVAGAAQPGVFEITEPQELLGLNDYKIPLRILITQIKNPAGEIKQVYVKYVIPEFASFAPTIEQLNQGPSPRHIQARLDRYRSEALVRACKETIKSYEVFMDSFTYDALQEWKMSTDGRAKYDTYRNMFYDDGVIRKSGIKPQERITRFLEASMTKSGAANRVPPPFRYPGTADNNQMATPGYVSLAASWISNSKLYSIAAQNEAKDKQRNFRVSNEHLDNQFKFPGNLVKIPKLNVGRQRTFNALNMGARENVRVLGETRNDSPNNLAPASDRFFRNVRLYQKLQEHWLYTHSMSSLLDPITGTSTELIQKPNEKSIQTIGNFVSWFNQRRADGFFGRTSGLDEDGKSNLVTLKRLQNTPAADRNIWSETNYADVEHGAVDCGPSLFYNDGRTHWIAACAANQRTGTTLSAYTTRGEAWQALSDYCGSSLTEYGRHDTFSVKSIPINILAGNYNIFNFRLFRLDADNKFRGYREWGRTVDGYLDQEVQPGEVFLPLTEDSGLTIGGVDTVKVDVRDLRDIGLYEEPYSTLPGIIEQDYSPELVYEQVLKNDFEAEMRRETTRAESYPQVITDITAQYNAALEQTGLPEIIREVTTTYVSRLEGDENIVTDILRDSDISHGLRIMQAKPYDSQAPVDRHIVDSWLHNSEVSEEERMGLVMVGDTEYRTYPITHYEHLLTSIECFMAATPMQFRQKLTDQLPYMKCKLQNEQSFKDFFDFMVPYKTYASMLAMHGITMLSGYGDMYTIMDSAKSGLAGAFSQAAQVEVPGEEEFGINFDSSDLITAFGTPGPVGGQEIDCFDLPNIGQWWKMIQEMLKQYAKYFPSVILRGIADSIDPAYKEMKRHYLSCELPDLTNDSWVLGSGAGNTPLGLRGGQTGEQKSKYAPVIPSFPYDVVKGAWRLPNPEYLLKSIDKLVGYIYGGPLPLLDPRAAFKVPCLDIDQQTPDSWAPYTVGNSGRYGQPLSIITLLALSTYQLPNDMELRRSICTRRNLSEPVIACEDEIE